MKTFRVLGFSFTAVVFLAFVIFPFLASGDYIELGNYSEAVVFTWGLMFCLFLGFPFLCLGKPSTNECLFRIILGIMLVLFVGAVNFIPDYFFQKDIIVKKSYMPDGATYVYASWRMADRRVGFERNVSSADETVIIFPRTIYPGKMWEIVYKRKEDRLCSTVKSGSNRFTNCINGGWWSVSFTTDTDQLLAWYFPPQVGEIRFEGLRRMSKLAFP